MTADGKFRQHWKADHACYLIRCESDLLAPLDGRQPARLHLPRRRSGAPARPRRQRPLRADPRHQPRAATTAPRHRHPRAPPRPSAPRRLVSLATPPSVLRKTSPQALACLRRRAARIAIYNCSNGNDLQPPSPCGKFSTLRITSYRYMLDFAT
jgi:hypothetical protein